MRALLAAFALLSFVAASTVPVASPLAAEKSEQVTKKGTKKKAAKKSSGAKKTVAKKKTAKPVQHG
ncbi:MAG: hypothetical protein IRZ04_15590 [Rhodospirillales bacterium]|nr:hypothetical protein [Rhodospirillales bacterium]